MACAVLGCTNISSHDLQNVPFFYFPKDPEISNKWVNACGWLELDTKKAIMCSIHFDEDCYNIEVKLLNSNTCITKTLKTTAVPTLYLPSSPPFIIKNCEDVDIKEVTILSIEENQENITFEIQPDNYLQPSTSQIALKNDNIKSNLDLQMLKMKNEKMRNKLEGLEKSNKLFEDAYQNICQEFSEINKRYRESKVKDLRVRNLLIPVDQQYELLKKVFSDSQIKIITGKKKIYWSNDDMAMACVLRQLSSKTCYTFLTKKLKIPLPATSSVKRWVSHNSQKKKDKEGNDNVDMFLANE